MPGIIGADGRTRTADLLITNWLLFSGMHPLGRRPEVPVQCERRADSYQRFGEFAGGGTGPIRSPEVGWGCAGAVRVERQKNWPRCDIKTDPALWWTEGAFPTEAGDGDQPGVSFRSPFAGARSLG